MITVGELREMCETLPDNAGVLIELPEGGFPRPWPDQTIGTATNDPGLVIRANRRSGIWY